MKKIAHELFIDIWRLTYRYDFHKLNDEQWESFIADAEALQSKYKNTQAESLFRYLFIAVNAYYESLNK